MSNTRAARAVTALVAAAVLLGAVAAGGVAQTDGENNAASGGGAEPNDEPANATALSYGETVNGTLSSGEDVDYYAVNATAGDGLISRLALKNMFSESVIAIDVVNPNGEVSTELISDMINGPNNLAGEARPPMVPRRAAVAADTMESDGTYYIRVQESNLAETERNVTYRYNLSATTEDLDQYEPNEDATSASALDLGTDANATITGYDDDVYAVNLTAGQNYTVNFSAPGAAGYEEKPLPLSLLVYDNASVISEGEDPDGENVTAGEGGFFGRLSVTFTAEGNGTHYVELTEHGTNYNLLATTNYTLSVAENGSATTTETPSTDDGEAEWPGDDTTASPSPDDETTTSDDGNVTETPTSDDGATTETPTDGDETDELPADGDYDGDSITNAEERELGTDPRSADSDGDGLTDDCELQRGTDPLDPDTDDDGAQDGAEI